ncbi:MAG: hypothetical protein ACXAC6_02980 [Candidatus Hodarchaeales archaeon]|jgi:hypothetical protein
MTENLIISGIELVSQLLLLATFGIFIIIIYREITQDRNTFSSHSVFFSIFLASWLILEILSTSIFTNNLLFEQIVHFIILIILALWMNIRFFWARDQAKKISEQELKKQFE